MEILKNLSENELDKLRDVFNKTNLRRALNEDEFEHALSMSIQDKSICVSHAYFSKLFASIDVAGSGYVSWDEFTTFAIEQASGLVTDSCTADGSVGSAKVSRRRRTTRSRSKKSMYEVDEVKSVENRGSLRNAPFLSNEARSSDTNRIECVSATECESSKNESISSSISMASLSSVRNMDSFDTFRPFHIDQNFSQPYGWELVNLRVIKSAQKLVKLSHDTKGKCVLSVYDVRRDEQLSFYAGISLSNETMLDWDYIPATPSCIYSSNTLACSYNGGIVRLFTLERKNFANDNLTLLKTLNVYETKTNTRWCSAYDGRLAVGNRYGAVGLWDVENEVLTAEKRIHSRDITALCPHGTKLYSASLDRTNSVKLTDLERLETRTAFNDHGISGALCLEVDDEYLFSAGFESKIVQRPVQCPKSHPTFLYDSFQPHECHVTCIRRLEDGPYLITADAKGCVKVWDLRMGSSVQTISMQQAVRQNDRKMNNREDYSAAGKLRQVTCKVADSIHSFHRESKRKKITHETGGRVRYSSTQSSMVGFGNSCTNRMLQKSTATLTDNRMFVNTICPFVGSSFFVVMPKKMYLLGCAETTCPDLVDDKISCRLLLIPDPTMILTVHERSAKLWHTSNGNLIYTTESSLLQSDITACTLVEPLRRQFLLASITGELLSFSVSLGQCTHSLSSVLEGAGRGGKEILMLHTLPSYRDHLCPYVIVSYVDGVVLLPLVKDCEARNVLSLGVLKKLLASSGGGSVAPGRAAPGSTIRDTKLMGRKLFVCDSNAYLYVVDLLSKNNSTFTLKLPILDAELIFLSPFLELTQQRNGFVNDAEMEEDKELLCSLLHSRPQSVASYNPSPVVRVVFMVTSSTGGIIVGQSTLHRGQIREPRRDSISSDNSAAAALRHPDYEVIAEWHPFAERAGEGGGWRWHPPAPSTPPPFPPPSPPPPASVGFPPLRVGVAAPSLPPLLAGLPLSHGGTVRVVVLHVVWLPPGGVVALADNYGYVRVWDLLEVLHRPPAEPVAMGKTWRASSLAGRGGPGPVVMAAWQAHPSRITAMKCVTVAIPPGRETEERLPVLLTSGVDRRVCLWSADGVLLGTLATGRQIDNLSHGKLYMLQEYLLSVHGVEGKWKHYREYLAQQHTRLRSGRATPTKLSTLNPLTSNFYDRWDCEGEDSGNFI